GEMVGQAALPYLAYVVLRGRGASTVDALAAGAVFPAAFIAVNFARRRRLDGFGLAILATIAAGVGLSLISGNPRFALVKESVVTGAFGLAMLGSLLGRRPLMFYFGRRFATDGSPAGHAAWASYWDRSPTFRRSNRVMTTVWGVAFVVEAAIRVVAAYTLSTSTVVGLSATVPLVVVGLLMAWTFAYGGRTRARSRAEVVAYPATGTS
ncbi:MAG TPA: VC0807 family protein, partial [Solirubrobacteraceae bacterium]|nr:VC0807 family protein [Solirubrobacteraceae bacterium]